MCDLIVKGVEVLLGRVMVGSHVAWEIGRGGNEKMSNANVPPGGARNYRYEEEEKEETPKQLEEKRNSDIRARIFGGPCSR